MSRIEITYSPAYTLVPTYECFNRCTYCNFRRDPGQDIWLTIEAAQRRLEALPVELPGISQPAPQPPSIIEILLLSGEVHPRSSRRQAWLAHIHQLCELALSMGFLPHTNAGPLSYDEMRQLKQVNVSMGLMLEQLTPVLLETVHRHAPSKLPQVRLQQLEWAGQLRIPFTTGLLLGIGEMIDDWAETLVAIATLHQRYGHIQEVILQPHQPGTHQQDLGSACRGDMLLNAVKLAREILPTEITLQIPPNLVKSSTLLLSCLQAGARDLGGLVPHDEVNPDYPHEDTTALAGTLARENYALQPRLPIYPHYDEWLAPGLRASVARWRANLRRRKNDNNFLGNES